MNTALLCLACMLASASPLDVAGAQVISRLGDSILVAQPEPRGPDNTDIRMPREMAVRVSGTWRKPPEPVLNAALMANGVVAWATVSGALLLDDGNSIRRISEDALPELAVSPSGKQLAFAGRAGTNAGVFLVDARRNPRRVSVGMLTADRPLFVTEQQLLVVGADERGVAGIWLLRVDTSPVQARVLTNGHLAVGGGPWTGFVPVPADHASMRVVDGWLHYFDGQSQQRVALPGVKP